MAQVIETIVQYYDIGDREFKGGAKLHSIKTPDGKKYTAFVKGPALANPGDKIKTVVEENDKGHLNFHSSKFKVLERGKGHQSNGKFSPSSAYGIEVGHAINNAVHWLGYTAGGNPITVKEIEECAGEIFRLSHKLKAQANEGTLFLEPKEQSNEF